ncbi:serine hydrolase [Pseudoscardovia radai]|uniref:serine hydrolase n=1 Tax=Pseudoscardovia radai TaxID=987066 RepID=UPI00399465F5
MNRAYEPSDGPEQDDARFSDPSSESSVGTAQEASRTRRRHPALIVIAIVIVVALVVGCGLYARYRMTRNGAGASSEAAAATETSAAGTETPDAADADLMKEAPVPEPSTPRNVDITADMQPTLDSIFAGADYAVQVVSMANDATIVSIDPEQQFTGASTYKLFVAYSMISAVENGTMTWDTPFNGQTLGSCFDTMIVNSDNACPLAWLNMKNPLTVQQEMRDAGFMNSGFADDSYVTAGDLADYLTRLYKGTFMDPDSRAKLLEDMTTQVYRSGIPTGIGEHGTVADKVGFLYGLLHDAAIVYSDKGDYVMVILTDGSSWGAIAQAAGAIYDAL